MKTRIVAVSAAFLLVFFAQSASATNDDKLSITLTAHAITASGLSPGSSAVFFGTALVPIPHGYMNRVRRWAVIVDDTANQGTVTFDLQESIPPVSVWAVVDLRNAHYKTVSGPGFGIREIALDNALRKGQSQNVDRFSFDRGYLDLLYVQPGTGAWTWSVIGGTTADNGGPKNSTIVSLIDGKAVGQARQKPPGFLPGGILVAIDFSRLHIGVVRVDQQLVEGAP
jgi:hypothetical protein